MVMISRDPFARQELHRESVRADHETCAWCGGTRAHEGYLFRYSVETDGGRKFPDNKLFCSRVCRDTYYSP